MQNDDTPSCSSTKNESHAIPESTRTPASSASPATTAATSGVAWCNSISYREYGAPVSSARSSREFHE
jgi:hypothetical protein